jgi:hypothetical protein
MAAARTVMVTLVNLGPAFVAQLAKSIVVSTTIKGEIAHTVPYGLSSSNL